MTRASPAHQAVCEDVDVKNNPLIDLGSCASKQSEYWYHVAPQEEMPLAGTSRQARLLNSLDAFYPTHSDYAPGSISTSTIADWLLQRPDLAHELRLVLSLSDKRFYLDLSYQFSRQLVSDGANSTTICGCAPHEMKRHTTSALLNMLRTGTGDRRRRAAEVMSRYLVKKGLLIVLDLYFGLDQLRRTAVNDLWLAPHDVQQNETKRRGHGAEAEIARALVDAGINVFPPDKATAPMGASDPNISMIDFSVTKRKPGETFSADIIVLNTAGSVQVLAMGLVQSSDPGQFGVDKAATNGAIRTLLNDFRATTGSTIELWGIVDGIGYAENPNGTINRMLEHFDEFVQHNSAYKSILAAHRLGLCNVVAIYFDEDFYSDTTASQMHSRYAPDIERKSDEDNAPPDATRVRAGRATLWLEDRV